MPVLEDFEDDLSSWNNIVGSWAISSDSIVGSQSGKAEVDGSNNPNAGEVGQLNVSSQQPSELSFWYKEPSTNLKAGLTLFDGNGNYIIGAGSDNPQYLYSTDGVNDTREGTNIETYNVWIEVTFTFDWSSGTVNIDWVPNDTSISSGSVTGVSLGTSNPIETVGVGGITESNTSYMWYDQIQTPTQGFDIYIDGTQVKDITIDGTTVQNVTIDGTTI